MNIFFTSDTHFGHKNIIDYCKRPYASVEEMDAALEKNWNETVKPNDKVYHLGDFAFHNYEIIDRLNGHIILIPGNHDHERGDKVKSRVAQVTEEVHYLKIDPEHRFVLCHYPFESWRREYRFHLHGHTHGTAGVKHNRLDVGVDATKIMAPIHLDDMMQLMTVNNLWAMEMNK